MADWKKKFKEAVAAKVRRGDYRGGLVIAKRALAEHPKDFDCRFQYAKLLGDWADELPPAEKKKKKRESLAIIRPLLRALSGIPADSRFSVCLNYYYQSESFVPMVAFGRRLVAKGDRQGYYAIGLGAALEATRLRGAKNPKASAARAKRWAEKSVAAWKKYRLAGVDYYFPHYVLALAYGVLGRKKEGWESLRQAAKHAGRPTSDWEFADAVALLTSVFT
jgi:hypothetical protein